MKELPFSDDFDDVEVGVDAPDISNVKESPVALSAQVSDLSAILKRFTLQFKNRISKCEFCGWL